MRIYWGARVTHRGLKPYLGINLGSLHLGKRQAVRVQKVVYHCSNCGALNGKDAHFCQKCGAAFTGPVVGP